MIFAEYTTELVKAGEGSPHNILHKFLHPDQAQAFLSFLTQKQVILCDCFVKKFSHGI